MAKFNENSTWNGNGLRRFERFKKSYPNAYISYNGLSTLKPVSHYDTWEDIKTELRVPGPKGGYGANPSSKGYKIIIDNKEYKLKDLEDKYVRKPGIHSQDMEILVSIAALIDVNDWSDFIRYVDDVDLNTKLFSRMQGLVQKDIDRVIDAADGDESFANTFIEVGKNIRKETSIKSDLENYSLLNQQAWRNIKNHAAELLSEDLSQKTLGDKWNPADIVFVHKGFRLSMLPTTGNIHDFNTAFNKCVEDGLIVPVSVKKDKEALTGSRGIAKEIPPNFQDIKISDVFTKYHGKIHNVPVYLNYDKSRVKDDLTIQRKAIGWIQTMGKSHVEQTAAIALGLIPQSSVWYTISSNHFVKNFEKSKTIPKLDKIVISMTSKSVWLGFKDGEFVTCRTKGGESMVLTSEKSRKNFKPTPFEDIPETHKEILERLNYSVEDIDIL